MTTFVPAFLIGVTAGLRTFTPIAAVSWAATTGPLSLANTWLAFLGYSAAPYIASVLAVGELVNDKLPKTPSRKIPPQFIARLVSGSLSGAAIGAPSGAWIPGSLAGALGAVAGTLGGAEIRARMARAFGKDLPAALIEDAVAVLAAFLIAFHLS